MLASKIMVQGIKAGICKPNPRPTGHPYSNTGMEAPSIGVRPDGVRLSFRQEKFAQNIKNIALAFVIRLGRTGGLMGGGWTLTPGKGRNGFKDSWNLYQNGELRASLEWGGASQRGWILLDLRGGACALLTNWHWCSLWRGAQKYGARLGGIDIAGDDLTGELLNFRAIFDDFNEKPESFWPIGRRNDGPPDAEVDSSTGATGGATLYVGSKTASIRLRIYEKGREKADTSEGRKWPLWVRFESCFRRTQCVELDLNLIHPDFWCEALLGSSQYLSELLEIKGYRFMHPIPPNPFAEPLEKAAKGIYAMRRTWGGYISHYRRIMGDKAFLDALERDTDNALEHLTPGHLPGIKQHLRALLDSEPKATDRSASEALYYRLNSAGKLIKNGGRS